MTCTCTYSTTQAGDSTTAATTNTTSYIISRPLNPHSSLRVGSACVAPATDSAGWLACPVNRDMDWVLVIVVVVVGIGVVVIIVVILVEVKRVSKFLEIKDGGIVV